MEAVGSINAAGQEAKKEVLVHCFRAFNTLISNGKERNIREGVIMHPLLTSGLLLALCSMAAAQTVPAGWKSVKEGKGACQAAVPPDWALASEPGMAKTKDTGTVLAPSGMVVVTSDVDRLHPMPEAVQKMFEAQMIENTDKRVFYFHEDRNGKQYTATVPGKGGNGRCHATVSFLPAKVKDEIAKQVALSISPVK